MPSIRQLIPGWLRQLRHFFYAWWGAVKYGHPSEELVVIGVTGTSGKSTTIYLLRQILEAAGYKVGALSTIEFSIAGRSQLNDQKMTMLGRMQIQKYLRAMAEAKCDIAIIETTSEGAVQYRHRFVNYDIMVLTNLYPEHIESHGSFDAYKSAKRKIFSYVAHSKRKKLVGAMITKTAIVNGNNEYVREFLCFPFEKKLVFGRADKPFYTEEAPPLKASVIHADAQALNFSLDQRSFRAPLMGEHNVMNILAAICVARSLRIDWPMIGKAAAQLHGAPGRLEPISEAQGLGIQVLVDYAFEPVAMTALYQTVEALKPRRIIHVFGATGGGRDRSRRAALGKFIGERADICIITNEDPYDDDPMSIIKEVANAVETTGKKEASSLYIIEDREQAIGQAIHLAEIGDLVLITGKGSEQGIVVRGKIIPWDDRAVVRRLLMDIEAKTL